MANDTDTSAAQDTPDARDDSTTTTTNSAAQAGVIAREVGRRRTFGIISHPDAGKTTLTEKLLWFGGAIQLAGSVRARKSSKHATSDWMELE